MTKSWRFTVRRGTQDAEAVDQVYARNEYGLPDDMTGWDVLDLGANVGAFAAACLERNARMVVCVEPVPEAYDLLVENVHNGSFAEPRVRTILAAVHEQGGILAPVAVPPAWTACARVLRESQSDLALKSAGVRIVEAMTKSLDQLLVRHGPFRLVKLDIEGSELPVLSASMAILSRCSEVIGEAHKVGDRDALVVAKDCAMVLADAGFSHTTYGFHPWSGSTNAVFQAYAAGLGPEDVCNIVRDPQ